MNLLEMDFFSFFESSLFQYVILPLATGGITFFFSKKHFQVRELEKQDANIVMSKAENMNKHLDLYERMLEDLEVRYEEKINNCNREMLILEKTISEYKKIIIKLEKELEGYRNNK